MQNYANYGTLYNSGFNNNGSGNQKNGDVNVGKNSVKSCGSEMMGGNHPVPQAAPGYINPYCPPKLGAGNNFNDSCIVETGDVEVGNQITTAGNIDLSNYGIQNGNRIYGGINAGNYIA
ncbi:unnamed protein product [Amaranthus hypochondriacus]